VNESQSMPALLLIVQRLSTGRVGRTAQRVGEILKPHFSGILRCAAYILRNLVRTLLKLRMAARNHRIRLRAARLI